jgi:hypothetical protein
VGGEGIVLSPDLEGRLSQLIGGIQRARNKGLPLRWAMVMMMVMMMRMRMRMRMIVIVVMMMMVVVVAMTTKTDITLPPASLPSPGP